MVYRDSYSRLGGGMGFGFRLTPWVKRLLIANGVVFLLQLFAGPLGVGGLFRYFVFIPDLVFRQPWGAVTYMFLHGGFWHLLFNMLMLFFFGPPLEQQWGSREFIKYYVICGIGGAVFSFFFAPGAAVIGASAAVLGLMLAFALLWPKAPIYIWGIFPVPAWALVTIFAVITIFSAAGAADGIAHFAHLGGLAFGFLYVKFGDQANRSLTGLRKRVARRRLKVVEGDAPRATGAPPRSARSPRRHDEERMLDEVDRVLDKISKEGLSSLSTEERRVLDEASRKYRRD
jgi:membrane associated rhomboid family serine protease